MSGFICLPRIIDKGVCYFGFTNHCKQDISLVHKIFETLLLTRIYSRAGYLFILML